MLADLAPLLARFAPTWPAHLAVPEGWHPLLLEMDRFIAELAPDYRVREVGHKWGLLVVDLDLSSLPHDVAERRAVHRIVLAAKEAARVTCERCGRPGAAVQIQGWQAVLCAEHAAQGWYDRRAATWVGSERRDARPVVGLDVDGVVNALVPIMGSLGPNELMTGQIPAVHSVVLRVEDWPTGDGSTSGVRFLRPLTGPTEAARLWIDDRIGPWVGSLLERGVDVVWCTTWRRAANEYIAPLLGIPALPVIDGESGEDESAPEWKARLLTAYAAGRPLVWLDDRALALDAPDAYAGPSLTVRPHPEVGLTPAHRDEVDAWLKPWLAQSR